MRVYIEAESAASRTIADNPLESEFGSLLKVSDLPYHRAIMALVILHWTTVECAVTTPNGIVAGEEEYDPSSHGNLEVSAWPFGLWPDGTAIFKPGGPGFVI
jgi:hypothetical protein